MQKIHYGSMDIWRKMGQHIVTENMFVPLETIFGWEF